MALGQCELLPHQEEIKMILVTFSASTTFRKCAASCGTIRHRIGFYEMAGTQRIAYACVRCCTTVLTDQVAGQGDENERDRSAVG